MKNLMSAAAASAFLLAGCGGGESSGADADTAARTTANQIKDVVLRAGDPAQADAALTAMSLNATGVGRVDFDGSSVDGADATFSNVSIGVDDDEDGLINVGTLSLKGLDMTPAGATFSELKFADVSISPPDEEGELRLGDVSLVNPSPELAAWVASLFGDGEPAPFPAADDIAFDRWSLSNLALDVAEGDGDVNLDLGSITMLGVTADSVGSMSVEGFSVNVFDPDEDLNVDARLGSMSLSGGDLSLVRAIQDNIGLDEDEMAAAIFAQVYDNPLDPGFDSLTMSDFAVDVEGVSFAAPSIEYFIERNGDGDPVKYVNPPYTMTLDIDQDGKFGAQAAAGLGMLGYERLELSGGGSADYDPDADILTMAADSNFITLADGFTMKYGGKIEGYSEYARSAASLSFEDEPDLDLLQEAISDLIFHDFELTLVDNSIMDRGFNLAAAQTGQDVEALRAQAQGVMAFLPLAAGESGVDPAILTELAQALSGFISEPGELTIKLDPSEPVSAASFVDPSQITKDSLGFSAKNE